jgi:hypothetical protein
VPRDALRPVVAQEDVQRLAQAQQAVHLRAGSADRVSHRMQGLCGSLVGAS